MQSKPISHDDGLPPGDGASDAQVAGSEDDAIRTLVERLSRRHHSGGQVIERAAILAAGSNSSAVLRWIAAHGGEPEELAVVTAGGGLHGARRHDSGGPARTPLRYVLPQGTLS